MIKTMIVSNIKSNKKTHTHKIQREKWEEKIQVNFCKIHTKNRNNYDKIHIHVNANDTILYRCCVSFRFFFYLSSFDFRVRWHIRHNQQEMKIKKQFFFSNFTKKNNVDKMISCAAAVIIVFTYSIHLHPLATLQICHYCGWKCSFWCGIMLHLAIQKKSTIFCCIIKTIRLLLFLFFWCGTVFFFLSQFLWNHSQGNRRKMHWLKIWHPTLHLKWCEWKS